MGSRPILGRGHTGERVFVRENLAQIAAATGGSQGGAAGCAAGAGKYLCFLLKLKVRHSGSSSM